ncbi:hypothetical protein [Reichenbachiella sp.]|uniref:hypothetical protein n=1 Tax=Reichenbachiella sp. TaxID=2184521 RepID=UPI003B58B5AE
MDFSTIHPLKRPINVTDYDVYHVTGGAKISFEKGSLVVGLQYSKGSDTNITQLANIDPQPNENLTFPPLQGPLKNELDAYYNSFALIFGLYIHL